MSSLLIALLLTASAGAGAELRPFYLRNHSPFLQSFGLPAPEGGWLTDAGTATTRLSFSVANNADTSDSSTESVILDGESYYTDLTLRYAPSRNWEMGLDIPYVAHRNGQLDNLIEGWHRTFGLDNGQRRGPSNDLALVYTRDGSVRTALRHGSGGLGDVRLSGAYRLYSSQDHRRSVALRGHVEFPTGSAAKLRGSGATDVAVSVEASDERLLGRWSMVTFAQAGVLAPGAGDLLGDQLEDAVPFGALGVAWPWRDNLALRLQLALQGEYLDSKLPDLGAGTATLAAGATFRFERLGVQFDLALIEDLISDATPDFGLYFSIASIGARLTMSQSLHPDG